MRWARWWLGVALAAAQLAMLLVTARVEGFDGGAPRYGFPFPYTWFAGFSSFHWTVSPLAWLVDLFVYALALAPPALLAGAAVGRLGGDAERKGSRALLVAGLLAFAALAVFVLLPATQGWEHLSWELPAAHGARTLAFAPFAPW